MKHHYIPAFYLRQWASDGGKGNLCEHKKVYGKVMPRGTSAEGTGYLEDLYRVEGVPPEIAHNFETIFMKLVDTDAKNALDKLLRTPATPWPSRLRSAWTRFITSLLFRNPETVTFVRNHILNMYSEATKALEADYAARRKPGDPETFEEFMARTDAAAPHVGAATMMQEIIDNARVGPTVYGMNWSRISVGGSKVPLLTSDRPLEMPLGLGRKDAYIALPVGPYDIFLAAHDPGMARAAVEENPTALVKKINRTTVARARRYVWGVDDRQLEFVRKHFGTLPDRKILTDDQIKQALDAARGSQVVPERVEATPPGSKPSSKASTARSNAHLARPSPFEARAPMARSHLRVTGQRSQRLSFTHTNDKTPAAVAAGASRSAGTRCETLEAIEDLVGRSSRCSDLLSVENSSALMPPTCSTVRTCF